MPPTLGPAYPVSWQGHPKHMSSRDFQLWRRYAAETGLPFIALYFDVALGSLNPAPVLPPETLARMWSSITAFRADVLAESVDHWTLIELRANAGPGALGSLLTYRELWHRDPPDDRPLELQLVTDELHPDLAGIVQHFSIKLFVL